MYVMNILPMNIYTHRKLSRLGIKYNSKIYFTVELKSIIELNVCAIIAHAVRDTIAKFLIFHLAIYGFVLCLNNSYVPLSCIPFIPDSRVIVERLSL